MSGTAVLKLHKLLPDGREDALELSEAALTIYPADQEQLPEALRGEIGLEHIELRIEQEKAEAEAEEEPRPRKKKPEPPRFWLRLRVTPPGGEERPRPVVLAWDSAHFDVAAAEAFADRFAAITGKEVRPAPEPATDEATEEQAEAAPEGAAEGQAEAAPDADAAPEAAPATEAES